jgi:ABC-2 type transport system permease protein
MTAAATGATALRVLTELRRDPRTVALLLFVPALLVTLLRFVFDGQEGTFDRLGGPLIGLFPFITMFLVTSITMLRERTGGTLERLMSMPVGKLDLLNGYGIAFAVMAAAQAAITAAVAFLLLGLDVGGSPATVVTLAIGNAVLGMALGLFVSAFASSEFQAVQFMPAFVLPQLMLCGLFVARDQMAGALEAISYALPLTYAFDALDRVATGDGFGGRGWLDVAVIVGVTLLALARSGRSHCAGGRREDHLKRPVVMVTTATTSSCAPHVPRTRLARRLRSRAQRERLENRSVWAGAYRRFACLRFRAFASACAPLPNAPARDEHQLRRPGLL